MLAPLVMMLVLHSLNRVEGSRIILQTGHSKDVCDEETFRAQCPSGSVLVIRNAEYGHLAISRCTPIDTGHFGCRESALSILSLRCNGRQSCEVSGEDPELKALKPCVRGLVVYLHVEHICVAAQPVDPCAPVSVGPLPAYISSLQASTAPCRQDSTGSLQIYLRAKLGQRVHMTTVNLKQSNGSSLPPRSSSEVGYVLDEKEDKVEAIMLGSGQETEHGDEENLFESISNEVTLGLHSNRDRHFLIVFEARGCEDLKLPNELLWVERTGETVSIGCTNSQKMWTLHCRGGRWTGVIGNCTQEVEYIVDALQMEKEIPLALPKDIVLMLIVGLTVVFALVIVTTGYVCYKRKYTVKIPKPNVDYETAYNNIQQARMAQPPPESAYPLLAPNASTLMRTNMGVPNQQEVHIWEHPLPVPPSSPHDIYATNTLRSIRGGRTNTATLNRQESNGPISDTNAVLINPESV